MARLLVAGAFLTSCIWSGECKAALLIIDVQDCFMPTGSLSVPKTDLIVPKINDLITNKACMFDSIVFTRDYHPPNHISFGSTHGLEPFSHLGGKGGLPMMCTKPESGLTKDGACCPTQYIDASAVDCGSQLCPPDGWSYDTDKPEIVTGNDACTKCKEDPSACNKMIQAMWTDHCLQEGDSTIQKDLIKTDADIIVHKGGNTFVDAYSAFADNIKAVKTELDDTLKAKGIEELYVVGIATDVCVIATVIDGLDSTLTKGYKITVITDATEAVMADATNKAKAEADMAAAGATLKTVEEVKAMECPAPSPEVADTSHGARSVTMSLLAASAMVVGVLGH
eukprot:gnl/TRDRNA2_/TRDRNA2_168173_c0_seq1.p1 gnl/TRDRNA2_/TRDRNA2_168173_c0~~gnl/TRDRNA2_/TRDRNA2_168173_c0_seq1.p1  ORF type:complete len:369 (-),score=63.64 gnl/TRDRNA2_/TRDRNA2_168173_c0_seq1:178-1194(-)